MKRLIGTVVLALACFALGAVAQRYYDTRWQARETAAVQPTPGIPAAPSVDFASQYALLARYNNYDQFFKTFERNNLSIGVVIRFPFFNAPQRAAAQAAHADAVKAKQEARGVKEQVTAETLQMQRSVQQLSAAREVAMLEHQLAQAEIEAAQAKIESGAASIKDEQNARVAEHERYTAYLSSSFDLDKAQVQLLRRVGELETWALGPTQR